jgi:SAM-dependent methyltransferase
MPDDTRAQRLREFIEWTRQHISGDEKGEAQVFLDRLFQAFGQRGVRDAGATLETRVKRRDSSATAFADLVWKPVVLIEMKKRGADLSRHFRQALDYWFTLVPNRPKWTILCNFDEFWIYDFDQDINEPVDRLTLDDLAQHYEALAFLFPTREEPKFRVNRLKVTHEAADLLAQVYGKLKNRVDVGPDTAQRFILQMLIALFSEDIKLLPQHIVGELLDECVDPPKAFDLLGGLFRAMNDPTGAKGGRFKDVPYFNGGIFKHPAPVELGSEEVRMLKRASGDFNWSHISPDIFGTIFQHSMNKEDRHKYGGHYTTPTDIMKIVKPTIADPWRWAIDEAGSKLSKLRALQQRLYTFTVLDPACGSGNFLYIAYRELKRIEAELTQRIAQAASRRERDQMAFGFVTSKQFFGMDIIPFAVELAKVTLTLAHKLAIDELHVEEKALPLDNLDENIRCVDALISPTSEVRATPEGRPPIAMGGRPDSVRTPWPRADVIIGNPPFLGAKRLKPERGAVYVNAVRELYPEVPGMADYCVYWIRRAHDHMQEATVDDPFRGRAGLVGTQNIRNNQSRVGGLDHVVKSGTIVEAVDNQPWSGEANVHVSIANWVKHAPPAARIAGAMYHDEKPLDEQLLIPAKRKLWVKVDASLPLYDPPPAKRGRKAVSVEGKRGRTRKDKSYELAFRETAQINSALSDETDVSVAKRLACNAEPHRVYQGVTPGHDGFVLSDEERRKLLAKDRLSDQVIFNYVTGDDLLDSDGVPNRYIIDFQARDLVDAQKSRGAFEHVKAAVLPDLERKARKEHAKESARKLHMQRWWMLWRNRSDFIRGLEMLRGR